MGSHLSGQKVRASTINGETMTVCTSASHPASPVAGQPIFETDTGLFAVYTGSFWAYIADQVSQTQVLTTNAASVTFQNLPACTRLVLFWRTRLSASGAQNMQMQVDGNVGSNYLWNFVDAINGTAGGAHSAGLNTFIIVGTVDGNAANYFASGDLSLDGWVNTNGYLTASGTWANFSTSTTDAVGTFGGLYQSAGPHNKFTLFPASSSFVAGSQFSLYGYN